MTELALHILDIANNSTVADAKSVTVEIVADTRADRLSVRIADDGKGMDEALLRRVSDPFATTRTTRRVGMGIPLFKMAATMANGDFSIESTLGKGTIVCAAFSIGHVDRQPLGDLASTIIALVGGAPQTEFRLVYTVDGRTYTFETCSVKKILGCDRLDDPITLEYLRDMIRENIEIVNEGVVL